MKKSILDLTKEERIELRFYLDSLTQHLDAIDRIEENSGDDWLKLSNLLIGKDNPQEAHLLVETNDNLLTETDLKHIKNTQTGLTDTQKAASDNLLKNIQVKDNNFEEELSLEEVMKKGGSVKQAEELERKKLEAPKKKGGGRPLGSKNKPKPKPKDVEPKLQAVPKPKETT